MGSGTPDAMKRARSSVMLLPGSTTPDSTSFASLGQRITGYKPPRAPPPPAPPPDLTDDAVKQARRNQLALLMAGRGRLSTFAAGPLGDTSAPQLARPSILGGA